MPVKVNAASIRSKMMSYMQSSEYKSDMKGKIAEARKNGRDGEEFGLDIISQKDMEDALQGLIRLLQSYSAGLPSSVAAHFDSLVASGISINSDDSGATATVSFAGDLSRPSLTSYTIPVDLPGQPEGYGHSWHNMNQMGYSGGGGIDDIVSLFDTGYHASARVFGYMPGVGFVASLQDRPALGFLEAAIDAFNAQYGSFANASLG